MIVPLLRRLVAGLSAVASVRSHYTCGEQNGIERGLPRRISIFSWHHSTSAPISFMYHRRCVISLNKWH